MYVCMYVCMCVVPSTHSAVVGERIGDDTVTRHQRVGRSWAGLRAWPCRQLYIMTLSLYMTRSGTSSQCSSVWRSLDKPRSNFFVPVTTRFAAFNTRWTCLSSLLAHRPTPGEHYSNRRATLQMHGRVWLRIPHPVSTVKFPWIHQTI